MAAKKPNAYRVIGAVAVIRKDKHERYVNRNGIVLADDIDEANAKHLVEAKLIEPFVLADAPAADSGKAITQADLDAAVKAATEAQAAELKQAIADRDAAKAELEKVAPKS